MTVTWKNLSEEIRISFKVETGNELMHTRRLAEEASIRKTKLLTACPIA